MYYVYVLYSEKSNLHYTGFTTDLENRMKSHNELGTKDWTIRHRPWRLIHYEQYDDKKIALKREKWLKSGVGRTFIKQLTTGICQNKTI